MSGQSGPATEAPKAGAPAATSGGQNAPQTSGMSAPIPKGPTSTPKDKVMSVAEAEQVAAGGDVVACREATRKLRLAGVDVPSPLLALAALDPKFYTPQP